MQYKQFGAKLIVRLDQGEELIETLRLLCQQENIRLATVSAIGALSRVSIGAFEQDTKKYHTKEISGSMEITSLLGNISRMNEMVYIHLHINLTDLSFNTFGGHLNQGWIGPTCELILEIIDGEVDRLWSEEVGLNLIKFNKL